jgi:predicted phosphodiesterase
MKGIEATTGIICSRATSLEIEGNRTFLCHGDSLVSPLLPALIKTRPILSIMDKLGPALTWRVAMLFRIILSKKQKPYNTRAKRALREHAKKKFAEGYDVVVFGHSHVADRVEYGPGKGKRLYLNTGDLSRYGNYVEYTSAEGFQMRTFPPMGDQS